MDEIDKRSAERINFSSIAILSYGRLLVVLAAILWSLAGVFIKSLALPAGTIAFYRFLFAAIFFLFFLRPEHATINRYLVFSVVTYVIATGTFVWANKLTTAANAIVLQYTAPVYIYALIPLLFRERINIVDLSTLVGGMVGIAIIFSGSLGTPDIIGVVIALFSGAVFALYIVNLRFLGAVSVTFLLLVNNAGGIAAFLPLAWGDLSVSNVQLLALVCMGIFQFGLAYFVFSKGVASTSLQEASLLLLLEPVLNPLWVNLIVGEAPDVSTVLGGSIVLLSLGVRYSIGLIVGKKRGLL